MTAGYNLSTFPYTGVYLYNYDYGNIHCSANEISRKIRKRWRMKKWHKRILYTGLIAALLYAVWFYYTQPHFWKELDPARPGFDVTKFRFEDYPELEDLKYVIETIIPLGTDIHDAKKILRAEPSSESYVKGPYCIDNLSSRYTFSAQIYSPLKIISNLNSF